MPKLKAILCAGILLSVANPLVQAQTSAQIIGVVRDQSGQAIASASVEAVGQKSAEKRKLTTQKDGSFALADLPPDVYQVSATCAICSDTSKVVEVGAGQSRSIDIALDTNSASSLIAVDDHAVTLDATSPKMGMNVSATEISSLPVNGRTFAPLALTAPFVTNAGGASFQDLRYAGQPAEQNNYLLDGLDTSSVISSSPGYLPLSGYTFRLRNSLDTVDEFRVDSLGYSAEDGSSTGAQIKLVSKSGSDGWHGSLFEYFRNDHLQARNFFDGEKPSPLHMNQFGASAGGDLIKDKLFLFGSFEELKQSTGFQSFELVPSAEARSRAVTTIQPVLQALPAGFSSTGDPDVDLAQRDGVASQNESNQNVRLDYLQSAKSRFFLRYSRSGANLLSPDSTATDRNIAAKSSPDQSVLSWSYQISGTLINQATLGLNRAPMTLNVQSANSPDDSRIMIGGATSGGFASPGDLMLFSNGSYADSVDYHGRTYNLHDGLTWMKGAHSVQMGGDTRVLRVPFSMSGGMLYSLRDVDSLLSNEDVDVTYFADLSKRVAEQEQYAGYIQDQWRITPQVQAVFGLRYDYYSAMREQHNLASLLNYTNFTTTSPNGAFYNASRVGFEPRAGITWSPKRLKGDTVLRAGAGIYNGPTGLLDAMWPIQNSAPGSFERGMAFPLTASQITNSSSAISNQRALDLSSFGRPQQNYVLTASVQQALPHKLVGQAAYTGVLSRHLTQESFANISTAVDPATGNTIPANPAYSVIPFLTNAGNSSYHGLQLGLNRHLADNLTLTTSYNWSHSIGDSQGAGEEMAPQNPLCLECEHGDNNFDTRHSFSANAIYAVPFGKGRKLFNKGIGSALFGGWTMAGAWNAHSGLPVNVLVSRANEIYYSNSTAQYYSPSADLPADAHAVVNAPYGLEGLGAFRPNIVPGVNPYIKSENGITWLNPAAFAMPLPGTFGNLGRNALRGPGFTQVDIQISRRFAITERNALTMKVEAFNLFNHANFSNPTAILPDSTIDVQPGTPYTSDLAAGFGSLTSTVGRTVGLGTSRQLQLSARFDF
jgi:hypothetical protein